MPSPRIAPVLTPYWEEIGDLMRDLYRGRYGISMGTLSRVLFACSIPFTTRIRKVTKVRRWATARAPHTKVGQL